MIRFEILETLKREREIKIGMEKKIDSCLTIISRISIAPSVRVFKKKGI